MYERDAQRVVDKVLESHNKLMDTLIISKLKKLEKEAQEKDHLLYANMIGYDYRNPEMLSILSENLKAAGYELELTKPEIKITSEAFKFTSIINTNDIKLVVKKKVFEI